MKKCQFQGKCVIHCFPLVMLLSSLGLLWRKMACFESSPLGVTWWLWMLEGPGYMWYSFQAFLNYAFSQVNSGYPVSFIQTSQWTDIAWFLFTPQQPQQKFWSILGKRVSSGKLFLCCLTPLLSMLWCVNMCVFVGVFTCVWRASAIYSARITKCVTL